jgi:O-acetyl-ADP-ribose deacetylase (regulator of RNase III)
MSITYIKGNLFETEHTHILHGCNAQGVMGSGVAAIVRRDYPEAYQDYLRIHREEGLILGFIHPCKSNNKIIINAITQHLFGKNGSRFVSYDAVAECMHKVNLMNIQSVAMPKIGAGLGGGDWNVIEQIILSEVKDIPVYVYEL